MTRATACAALLAALVVAGVAAVVDAQTFVDIHLPLDPASNALALQMNTFLHTQLPSDDVYLGTVDKPHCTLYLTEFQNANLPVLVQRVQKVVSQLHQITYDLTNTFASGQYGMWNLTVNDALQFYSDLIVNNTYDLIVPNQPVPSWVYSLPEPERSEKIAMVKKYGSPNVFSQFQPHVSLAFDNVTTESIPQAFTLLAQKFHTFRTGSTWAVALGSVGPHGTVLLNHDMALLPIAARRVD